MPKDFNQSMSLESCLKLQWFYSNTSTIIIRMLYVSNINTDCLQLFDSLFHTPLQANYNNCNSVCSPHSIIRELTNRRLSHDAAAGSRHSSALPSCGNLNLRYLVKTTTLVRAAGKFSRRF